MKKIELNKKDILKFILQIFVVAAAGLIGGASFKTFFESAGIVPTGLSGFALIITNLLEKIGLSLPTSIVYLVINVILFAFALRVFGWKFLVLSGIGMGCYIFAMHFGNISALTAGTDDKLLFAIIGAIISGLTIGTAFRFGGSTGGSDVMGAIINKYFPKIKTGYCILIINFVVLTLTIITGGVQTGLYALIFAILNSLTTNFVLDGSKRIMAYYIICDKYEEISDAILYRFKRGVTKIDAEGMYSKTDKKILLCLIPNEQAHDIKKMINEIDKDSYIFSTSIAETTGEKRISRKHAGLHARLKATNMQPILKNNVIYKKPEKIKNIKLKKRQKRFKYKKI